eukprot:6386132-Karenia_brevis.AAC.1
MIRWYRESNLSEDLISFAIHVMHGGCRTDLGLSIAVANDAQRSCGCFTMQSASECVLRGREI